MIIKTKKVTFTVFASKPGWFIDEALEKGLMISVQPNILIEFLEEDCKYNVVVYGIDKRVDNFIKYVKEQCFDVTIDKIEEKDLE